MVHYIEQANTNKAKLVTLEKCAVVRAVLTWQAQFIKVRPLLEDNRGFICRKIQTIGPTFLSCLPFSLIVDI